MDKALIIPPLLMFAVLCLILLLFGPLWLLAALVPAGLTQLAIHFWIDG